MMLMCALALSCDGCLFGELGWDLHGTVDIPFEVQQPYSVMRPGRVLQATRTALPGMAPKARFLLGVVCDPIAPTRQLPVTDSGFGCAETHDVVVWVEPFDPAQLAATPCDSKPRDWLISNLQEHPEKATAQARKTVFQFHAGCDVSDTVHLVLAPGRPS
jgi:hypothetical protein